ncbi:GIY-YIG nuclease family protein [Candidatus Thorarchaeota archaeon]|nr:MAG: GIY-YIG nuclease family protein [Candidatus Thorarchaeota archaeon]
MYFVYIIETEDGTYYTGMTNDLARRLNEHLSGTSRSATYLRSRRPIYIVHISECGTRSEAMKLEYRIKNDYTFKMSCIGQRRDIREVIDTELSYK